MPFYLLQVSYTAKALAALIEHPESREGAVRPVIEKLGGKIVGSWLAFGEHHAVAVCEMPDNVSAASFMMAVSASGAVQHVITTPLMTQAEALQAMKRASGLGYHAPGSGAGG